MFNNNNASVERNITYNIQDIKTKKLISEEIKRITEQEKRSITEKIYSEISSAVANQLKVKFSKHFHGPSYELSRGINLFLYKLNKKKYLENIDAIKHNNFILTNNNQNEKILPELAVGTKMYLRFHSTIILFRFNIESDDGYSNPYFKYSIDIYGFTKKDIMKTYKTMIKFINMANKKAAKGKDFIIDSIMDRNCFSATKQKRSFDTIFIDKDTKTKIIDYILNINNVYDYFKKYNIYPNRNILLYGPPGTGKTSIIMAICSLYEKINGAPLGVYSIGMKDMEKAVSIIRDRMHDKCDNNDKKIIILEDIDIIFGDRTDKMEKDEKNNINTLLQLLDGALSIEGSICIATTNNIERLDKAIIREGRFDLKLRIDNITDDIAKEMIEYYGANYDNFIDFVGDDIYETNSNLINPAKLQSKIIEYVVNDSISSK